jgi:hypothetical protein
MKPTEDESADELAREYRRASDAAGRPAAATRAAILAEARAAALRRTPAANDRRFLWRAVAGVAVLGVAVLVWRQVEQPLAPLATREAPVATIAPAEVGTAPGAAAHDASAQAKQAESEPRELSGAAQRAAVPAPAPAAALSVPFAASASAKARREMLDETPQTSLFRLHFPAEFQSPTPPGGVWILQDANGSVLRAGKLDAGEGFDALLTRLQREFPGRAIGPWEIVAVVNASGVPVQLGIARLP